MCKRCRVSHNWIIQARNNMLKSEIHSLVIAEFGRPSTQSFALGCIPKEAIINTAMPFQTSGAKTPILITPCQNARVRVFRPKIFSRGPVEVAHKHEALTTLFCWKLNRFNKIYKSRAVFVTGAPPKGNQHQVGQDQSSCLAATITKRFSGLSREAVLHQPSSTAKPPLTIR